MRNLSFFSKRKILFVLLLSLIVSVVIFSYSKNHITITTIYGKEKITEPVLIELINSKEMQRLKKIHQFGVVRYIYPVEKYSRYEHSLGVLTILRRHNASLEEQIAGLLHDVSHTAFSHIADLVFTKMQHTEQTKNVNKKIDIELKKYAIEAKYNKLEQSNIYEDKSYQDSIHKKYIHNTNIINILKKHNYAISKIWDYEKHFEMLEKDLPYLCADRIEYNIKEAFEKKLLSKNDLDNIMNDLTYKNGFWYFKTVESAKKFAMSSLYLTQNSWGSSRNLYVYEVFSEVLIKALKNKIITMNDMLYSVDEVVWKKIVSSKDPFIVEKLEQMQNYQANYKLSSHKDYDFIFKSKFRGVDPLVKTSKEFKKLSEIDKEFHSHFYAVKNVMERGWYAKR